MKKKELGKHFLGTLVLTLLACTACSKQAEADNITLEPTQEALETVTPVPSMAPTGTPTIAPTSEPTPTPTLLPTDTPVVTLTPELSGEAKLQLVTPVPESDVVDIAGRIAPEDYPVVDGSTATLPLSRAVYQLATGADEAMAENAIVHTKTTNSYYRLYDGEADLLIVYEPTQEIIERMQTEELLVKPIGLDALVFMANAANPVESLTTEQLIDIYAGKIKSWAEVGGTQQELLAFQRPAGSGSQSLMQKLVMKDVPMEEGDNVFRYSTMSDILEGMLAYTGDDNTLGYSVFYYANFMYSMPELRFMGVDGIMPSTQTIYDGSYPFVNAFYAVIRPDEPEDSGARKIFDWLTGEAGQQLVLDLGYVPVDKPEGAVLSDGIVPVAQQVELLDGYELSEGEHLIFHQLQEAKFEYEFPYGKLMIYDSKLELKETFYNAYTRIDDYEKSGRYSGRYLVIYQARATADGESSCLRRIYDLQEYCFVDLPWIEDLYYVLDEEKGFFVCINPEGDYTDAYRIVNWAGETLVSEICDFDYVAFYQMGNYYVAERYADVEEPWGKIVYWIYDEDLVLKNVIAAEEELPPVEERLPEVGYWVATMEQGCYLDKDGNILLNKEIFDATFGNVLENLPEEDFLVGNPVKLFDGEENELFWVKYGEENFYVDATLNVYTRKGEEQLYFRTEPEERFEYYFLGDGVGVTYFDSNGERLRMSDGVIPDIVRSFEKESYVLISQRADGTVVEEYRYGRELIGRYEYPWVLEQYAEVYYLGDARLLIRRAWENALEQGKENLKILIYEGAEQIACMDAAADSLTLACLDEKGKLCIQIIEDYYGNTEEKNWIYRDGKLSYIGISQPGNYYAKNGTLSLDYGNYTYMYDYDGNQIIKAYNRQMLEE